MVGTAGNFGECEALVRSARPDANGASFLVTGAGTCSAEVARSLVLVLCFNMWLFSMVFQTAGSYPGFICPTSNLAQHRS